MSSWSGEATQSSRIPQDVGHDWAMGMGHLKLALVERDNQCLMVIVQRLVYCAESEIDDLGSFSYRPKLKLRMRRLQRRKLPFQRQGQQRPPTQPQL